MTQAMGTTSAAGGGGVEKEISTYWNPWKVKCGSHVSNAAPPVT
jgi:hypothetical protein